MLSHSPSWMVPRYGLLRSATSDNGNSFIARLWWPQGHSQSLGAQSWWRHHSDFKPCKEEIRKHANYLGNGYPCVSKERESERPLANLHWSPQSCRQTKPFNNKSKLVPLDRALKIFHIYHYENCKPAKLREGAEEAAIPTKGQPKKATTLEDSSGMTEARSEADSNLA